MDLTITMIFYLLIGGGVAVGLALRERRSSAFQIFSNAIAAWLFWPLFVPLLLVRQGAAADSPTFDLTIDYLSPDDNMTQAIRHVEQELDVALRSLDGWAEPILSREVDRFQELRSAWRSQANRIRELDRLLADPTAQAVVVETCNDNKVEKSNRARRENLTQLKTIRDRQHHDLMGTIAWVRELVTMIHLAKHTGAPATRAEELIRQIATAVEGLTADAKVRAAASCREAADDSHATSTCMATRSD